MVQAITRDLSGFEDGGEHPEAHDESSVRTIVQAPLH